MRISEEQLRHDLIRVKDLLNHVPSKREYEKFGNYGKATYQRNWGSWNKALQDCLGEIRQISPASFIEVECIQCKSMFLPKSHDQKLCSKKKKDKKVQVLRQFDFLKSDILSGLYYKRKTGSWRKNIRRSRIPTWI
jgi:hypothetical protein